MTDPINNLPPQSQGQGLALGRAGNPLETVVDFMRPGVGFGQALQNAVDSGALNAADIDYGTLVDQFEQLPPGHQRQLADNIRGLPYPLQQAMERLGLAQPDNRGNPHPAGAAGYRSDGAGMPQGNGPVRGEAGFVNQALARGDVASPAAVARASGTIAAQAPSATQAQAASPTAPQAAPSLSGATPLDRALPATPPLQGGRVADGAVPLRSDAAPLAPQVDRPQAIQLPQQLPPLAVLAPQGRPDALPAQLLPLAATTTLAANPQGNVATVPQTAVPAAAQARDAQMAPAGHTLAGNLRDKPRKHVRPSHQRPSDWLLARLPGRRRRRSSAAEESLSFQWLFWILTIVAYGAVAIAVISMLPGGGRGLTDGLGRPSSGGYALIVGAVAAVASWFVGKRLSKRP